MDESSALWLVQLLVAIIMAVVGAWVHAVLRGVRDTIDTIKDDIATLQHALEMEQQRMSAFRHDKYVPLMSAAELLRLRVDRIEKQINGK